MLKFYFEKVKSFQVKWMWSPKCSSSQGSKVIYFFGSGLTNIDFVQRMIPLIKEKRVFIKIWCFLSLFLTEYTIKYRFGAFFNPFFVRNKFFPFIKIFQLIHNLFRYQNKAFRCNSIVFVVVRVFNFLLKIHFILFGGPKWIRTTILTLEESCPSIERWDHYLIVIQR